MGEYSIVFARSARHELEVLDPGIIRRILPKIESLANEPRPHGALKLTGEKRLWRIRIVPRLHRMSAFLLRILFETPSHADDRQADHFLGSLIESHHNTLADIEPRRWSRLPET